MPVSPHRMTRLLLPGLLALAALLLLSGVTLSATGAAPALTATPPPRGTITPAPSTSPQVSFGQGAYVQTVDPDGRRSVDFFVAQPRLDVPFTLHTLPLDRFRALYDTVTPWQPLQVDLAGLTQAAAWTETVNAETSAPRATLPASVTPGLYVLTAGSEGLGKAQLIVVVSRYVVALKGGDSQVGVWVMRLHDNAPPTAGATVELARGNATLARLETNADGWAETSLDWDDKVLALARVGDDLAVAGTRSEWQSDWSRWWGPGPNRYDNRRALVMTDRPIYRPGQDVFYKAIVRRDRDGVFDLPLPTDPITVTLKDPRANTVATRRLTLGEFGTVDGQFRLGDEASLGTYGLEVVHAADTFYRSFEVQAYRKPEFEVKVAVAPAPVTLGDQLTVEVNADYYFGAPVPNAPLTIRLKRGAWWGGETLAEVAGVTDAAGRWTGSLQTPDSLGYDASLLVEASVTDAAAQIVTAQMTVQGIWSALTLEARLPKYLYEKGETVNLTLTARDRQGRPVAGQTVEVVTRRYYDREPILETQRLTTGADGAALVTYAQPPLGWYNIEARARDPRGREAQAWAYFWVYDPATGAGWGVVNDTVEVSADKDSYAPGETARLLVRAPVTGPALLTLERGRVRRALLVNLTGAATVVSIPLDAGDAPNVYARVHLWRPTPATDPVNAWMSTPEGRLVMSQPLNLAVSAQDKRLDVTISAGQAEYRPGQTATLTLNVRDAGGQGRRAEVALALVDEAIYALAPDNTPDLFDHFYGSRSHGVNVWDSLRPARYRSFVDFYPPAPLPTGTPVGTPTPAAVTPGRGSNPPVRQVFRDTAYWNARVVTDEQGRATVNVTLPDNLTRWRVVARAVTTDTLVGMGESKLTVTQPLAAQPALPRFLTLGDRVGLDAVITNRTANAVEVSVTLSGTGLLLPDVGARRVDVPANGQSVARWSAVASRVGTAPVLCEADAGALGDAVSLPLPVQPFAIPERLARAGTVENTLDLAFDVPLNAVTETSSAELRLAPSIALSLLNGLDELVGYPYGCVEQTMSRVLPNAAVAQTYRRLGISNPDLERRLPDLMADGLQRLYGFQRPDGGWGWWYDDDSAVYQTAYVLFGLLQVEAAGFDVDDGVLARGLTFLAGQLVAQPSDPGPAPRPTETPRATATPTPREVTGLDPRLRAYALYVLALGGRPDLAQARSLLAQPDRLDPFGLAALALTLRKGGDLAASGQALDLLSGRAIETAGGVHWPAPTDGPYAWITMMSEEKTTALALRALATGRPSSPLLSGAARWLMNQRQGQGWSTTQATSFAILGLTDFILVSGELEADYMWRVTRDDVVLAEGHVTRDTATQPIPPITLQGSQLRPGRNTLRVEKTGRGQLYYSLLVKLSLFYPQFEAVSATGEGVKVSRVYRLSETGPGGADDLTPSPSPERRGGAEGEEPGGAPPPSLPGKGAGGLGIATPQTEYALGDVVEVWLAVEVSEAMSFVMVEDRLPAGFEPLQERMNPFVWDGWWFGPPLWREYGYNRKELRDDRVTFFATGLNAGRHEFTYRMRATRPGVFSALPAEVYPMYRPELWGRSASDRLTVARGAFVDPAPMRADADRSCGVTDFDLRQAVHRWQNGTEATTSLSDVAHVLTNLGRTCLDGEVPQGEPQAITPRLRLAPRQSVAQLGDTVLVDVILDGADQVTGYQATAYALTGGIQVDRVEAAPWSLALGPTLDAGRGQVTWGAVVERPTAGQGARLATLRLVARQAGMLDLALSGVEVLDAHGHAHAAAVEGARIEVRGYRLFLPHVPAGE